MSIEELYLDEIITPKTLLYAKTKYRITSVPDEYIIKGVIIEFDTELRKLRSVNIRDCHHPNAIDPTLKIVPPDKASSHTYWCMPDFLKKIELNNKNLTIIKELLEVWNFNECYWKNLNVIKYEKAITK